MNEEGEIFEDQPKADAEVLELDNFGDANVHEDPAEVVHGFEDANNEVNGFATNMLNDRQQQLNLRDMFKVEQSKKFEAKGGTDQQIALNAFTIRKTVDVKRLKHQLWDNVQPKLDAAA